MDNIVVIDSESDSDYSEASSDHDTRDEILYENTHFMNHVIVEEYEKNRNTLFTRDIEMIDILVDSYSIFSSGAGSETSEGINNYTFDLKNTYKNVIGFNLIKACIGQRNNAQEHLLDIEVPNIPSKACIYNPNGKHIIGRMCMIKGANVINEYEPEIIKDNYFFPISLDKISIKLYYTDTNSGTTQIYDSIKNNSFIFRLTVLNNLELMK
jgi:hypothetical protein